MQSSRHVTQRIRSKHALEAEQPSQRYPQHVSTGFEFSPSIVASHGPDLAPSALSKLQLSATVRNHSLSLRSESGALEHPILKQEPHLSPLHTAG